MNLSHTCAHTQKQDRGRPPLASFRRWSKLCQKCFPPSQMRTPLLRNAAAGCFGAYASCCSENRVATLLDSWALEASPADTWTRANRAHVLAAVAKHAAARMLAAGTMRNIAATIVRYSRDERDETKKCAAKALAFLAMEDPAVMKHAGTVLSALLGPDQYSDVQVQRLCHGH